MKQWILKAIDAVWDVLDALIFRFFRMADKTRLTRRIVLGITIWLTLDSFFWAKYYIQSLPTTSGAELGLIVAAVTAPVTALQAFAFKWYMEDGRLDPPKLPSNSQSKTTQE